jgi:ribonuclease P protein component
MNVLSLQFSMPKPFSYNKKEKLKSRKLMEQLFATGKSFSVFPIKVFYLRVDEAMDFPVKVGVGASNRVFKKAVDRNRIKRLLREAYRLNKLPLHDFIEAEKKQIAVFMLFIDKTLPSFAELQTKMPLAIDKLIKTLQ